MNQIKAKLAVLAAAAIFGITLLALPSPGAAAMPAVSAMPAQQNLSHADKEYSRAIERENRRHEKRVQEIQRKYRNHAQQAEMNRELREENRRHERALREAERNYDRNKKREQHHTERHYARER